MFWGARNGSHSDFFFELGEGELLGQWSHLENPPIGVGTDWLVENWEG